ncbi:Glycosylphosphatidylinositol-mannosyltransferase I, PIG-X/PBN1 [Sesbania bispinosa]|nr:Glycosylphosphatidylinositol-mannosyltransferase I, PIG-X/PBN1 [Sesbania bispinosa]
MSQEVTSGLCEALPDNHNFMLRLSVLKRNLIGEGSHRSVSTLIKFQTQQSESLSELLSYSCEFIIIERLPSGVFADPFELQRLVERGVFSDIAVFGDTNLELPSFLSNRSAVEIHLDVDPNILLEPTDINIELPLHARYQPLNESGYSTVEFGTPDMLVRCSKKEKVENLNCCFKLKNDDANLYDAVKVYTHSLMNKILADEM